MEGKILIYSIGSRGDFQPYLAFGKYLRDKGFQVALVTHDIFQADTEAAGISFFGIEQKDPNDILLSKEFKEAFYLGGMQDQAKVMGKGMDYMPGNYRKLWAAASTFLPDAVICTITTVSESLAVSQKLIVPMIVMSTIPYYATKEIAPTAAFATSFQYQFLNSFMYYLSGKVLWMVIAKYVNDFRSELLLSPQTGFDAESFPILNIYSERVVPDPSDWDHQRIQTVGYLIEPMSESYSPPSELAAFLESGPPPIYIGLGSMPILDCTKFTTDALLAMDRLRERVIFCAGWSELESIECPATCLFIKGAPHEWLFPRCKIVVHHGGAGTTAASLRAGVPTVIFSVLGDQPFWANRAYVLGVGPNPVENGIKSFSADRLEAVLKEVLSNPSFFEAAKALGQKLKEEDGCAKAFDFVSSYLAKHRNRGYGTCNWQVDASVESCNGCSSKFGFFTRKHHCRACGSIFCFACLKELPLVNYETAQLVCAACRSLREKVPGENAPPGGRSSVGKDSASRPPGEADGDASTSGTAAAAAAVPLVASGDMEGK